MMNSQRMEKIMSDDQLQVHINNAEYHTSKLWRNITVDDDVVMALEDLRFAIELLRKEQNK